MAELGYQQSENFTFEFVQASTIEEFERGYRSGESEYFGTRQIRLTSGNLRRQMSPARKLGMQLAPVPVRGPNDLDSQFKTVHGADGVLVLESSFFTTHRPQIVMLANTSRLPAIY